MNIDEPFDPSWRAVLNDEMNKPSFVQIGQFLQQKKQQGKIIYPEANLVFNAFKLTSFDQVKVVLLGQDPYHGAGQAHGLCFSVQDGIKPPPSLMNMYKELATDIGKEIPVGGNLSHWALQGVLMLNASLTVEANAPMSHSKIGWDQFTDAVIKKVSDEKNGIVFILWGQFAQAKEKLIDISRHTILKAAHPSPLSAYKGFFGCKHFSKTNTILQAQGEKEIHW
jgi:uracil-DNA glycosylase